MIEVLYEQDIVHATLPQRNQDVIELYLQEFDGVDYVASVVDGWNNPDMIPGNQTGRVAAQFVAAEYPRAFLAASARDFQARAWRATQQIERKFLQLYPEHVACVGAFLFSFEVQEIVVVVGDVRVLSWSGLFWEKLPGIGEYKLDPAQYPSGVSRFFGRGELKDDPFYSAKPDVVTCNRETPLLLATDGLEEVMTIADLNEFTQERKGDAPVAFVYALLNELEVNKTLDDDVAFLLRGYSALYDH